MTNQVQEISLHRVPRWGTKEKSKRRSFSVFTLIFLSLTFTLSTHSPMASAEEESADVRVFESAPFPPKLSQWNLFLKSGGRWVLNEGVLPFDLQNPLFSDYAHKYRTVWIPPGTKIKYVADGPLDFPQGTILSKTFSYPREEAPPEDLSETVAQEALPYPQDQLIETRLLVKTPKGWVGLPYVWNEDQSEAKLQIAGQKRELVWTDSQGQRIPFTYHVPNMNQCQSCHLGQDGFRRFIRPLGPTSMNLNRIYPYVAGPSHQLLTWKEKELLEGLPEISHVPSLPVWNKPDTGSLHERARAYLDINCAHCHNPQGAAKNSRLFLNIQNKDPLHLGLCKSPVAVGNAGGGLPYAIFPGRPDQSIMVYRLNSNKPEVMMPELGRSLIHREGVELISRWIAQMEGQCSPPASGGESGPRERVHESF